MANTPKRRMHLQALDLLSEIDPRLQRLLEKRRRGLTPVATCSTDRGEIAISARVSDIDAWHRMTEVRRGAEVRRAGTGEWIVTGRLPITRIGRVRQAPFVQSLKPALRLGPTLHATVEEIRAARNALPQGSLGDQGRGAVVGIVDFGCDFAHENLRREDGSTRLLALWDQSGVASPASPFGYGRLFEPAEIDAALRTATPYAALGYDPGPAAHGTHVADIAAGNGAGTGAPGVAPNSDLIFVHLAGTDVPWEGETVVGRSFGDSVQLLEALAFIFQLAGTRPCVVNVSLGTNGGPHDGSTLVEQGMDDLVSEKPNRAIVVAASNSYDDGIHAAGSVPAGGHVDLAWRVSDADATHNELEVWYEEEDELAVEIIAPAGESLGTVALGDSGRVQDEDGNTLVFIAHRRRDPNNSDNVAGVFLERGAPGGDWIIRLHAVAIQNGGFHAWIERDDAAPSCFVPPHDNTHNLGSISCGAKTIVVGSYDAHRPDVPLSWFSSSGPTRDARNKPELSAPGHDVWAAASTSQDGSLRMSGTSMAAPAVTGVVALALAEGLACGVDLPVDTIRQILASTARLTSPSVTWDARYGEGRVDARAVVEEVRKLGQQPVQRATKRTVRRPTQSPQP